MKTKLNNHVRSLIVTGLINHRFEKREKELSNIENALGDVFYDTLDGAQKKILEKAPRDWFKVSDGVYVYVEGQSHHWRFSKSRRVPYAWTCRYDAPKLSKSEPVAKSALACAAERERIREEKTAIRAAVNATITTFKYVEDLVESWPEVKKFIPKDVKKAMTSALAIPPRKLNEMLGLS
jgi:hypothetical protein